MQKLNTAAAKETAKVFVGIVAMAFFICVVFLFIPVPYIMMALGLAAVVYAVKAIYDYYVWKFSINKDQPEL